MEIDVVDLDDIRPSIRLGIKKGALFLTHVLAFLQRRFRDDENPIPTDGTARVQFYYADEPLVGDVIPQGISSLLYRVELEGDGQAIRLAWSAHVQLAQSQAARIESEIEAGITVGSLRSIIAASIGASDAFRIVVSARGGLRPGLLQGNNWEARRIQAWLCRSIFIDVVLAGNYVIVRGVNEEYLFHPSIDTERSLDFRLLRHWLGKKLLTGVYHPRSSVRLVVDVDDARLTCEGQLLKKRSRVGLGQTVEFELTRSVQDRFTEAEAWLVPQNETCVVCGDEKRLSELPARITARCGHPSVTCRDCAGQWIASSLETTGWDRLRCPDCSELLNFEEVRALASPEAFRRYDDLATKAALAGTREFRWCLNTRCGAGQMHAADCPKIRCHACKASFCSHHNIPWHSGETCQAYDQRTRRQRKSDVASEKKVREITKACPQCHKDVYKYSGCDHITCEYPPFVANAHGLTVFPLLGVCSHEWCYVCLAPYYHDRQAFLRCEHKRECQYFSPPQPLGGVRAPGPYLPFGGRANGRPAVPVPYLPFGGPALGRPGLARNEPPPLPPPALPDRANPSTPSVPQPRARRPGMDTVEWVLQGDFRRRWHRRNLDDNLMAVPPEITSEPQGQRAH